MINSFLIERLTHILPVLVLLLNAGFLKAQDYHKIDSLKQILKTSPELNGTDRDTSRMQVCLDIGNLFYLSIPDSSDYWYTSIVDTSFDVNIINQYPKRAKLNAIILRYIGINKFTKGNYVSAKEIINLSLKYYETLDNGKGISRCLSNLGSIAYDNCDYLSALSYYERALIISEKLADKYGKSMCNINMGGIYFKQCNYSTALIFFNRSLKIYEELGDKQGISDSYNNIGMVYKGQSNYPSTVSFLERSLKISEEIGNIRGVSRCLNNLGIVMYEQGNYPLAISYYNQALRINIELGDKMGISDVLQNIGAAESSSLNYLSALNLIDSALKIKEELADKEGVSRCIQSKGNILKRQGNYISAKLYLESALEKDEEIGNKFGMAKGLNILGEVMWYQNKYDSTIYFFERSLKIFEELGNKDMIAFTLLNLSKAYLGYKTPMEAFPLLQKSKNLTLSLLQENFCILSEIEKELYLNKSKDIFNEIHSFNIVYPNQNDSLDGICYNNELILKGLLLKSTQNILYIASNSPDTSLKNSYFLLKQFRNKVSSLQGSEDNNRDSLIADYENKANEQERKLVKLSSEFANIQNLFNCKWEDIQKSLKPNEAAIEFVSFTKGENKDTVVYAALLITSICKMPISVKLFEDSELQRILGTSTESGFDYVNSLYGRKSTDLYNLIWKPLELSLAGIKTIYFAPVGVLNKISFASLSKESGKMLCDIYNLQQVSTTGKLISKEDTKEMKMTAAVFGGIDYNPDTVKLEAWKYLPGTLNEKESIEKQFKKNKIACTSFSGKEAKEDAFKALFDSTGAPAILHVSTHGFFYPEPEVLKKDTVKEKITEEGQLAFRGSNGFGNWMFLNNKNPMMRSGLVFAGANRVWSEDWGRTDNEGVLTAYEVSNMNMRNTQLVVLSACETGLGDIKGSEGVYGLQRAFKMAGVKYIIMSLWQVPDKETVEFMEMFYKKLLKSKDVRTSFNETQKEMRKKYDPYFWAAFVLIE